MSSSRRDFLKFLSIGGLAASASALAGRALASTGAELPAGNIGVLPGTLAEKLDKQPKRDMAGIPILRLAQDQSQWVREGRAVAGHWFKHSYGAKNAAQLGYRVPFLRMEGCGAKAMRFTQPRIGTLPVEIHTDIDSPGFLSIVRQANGPHESAVGCMWGPVFRLTDHDGEQYELFCGTKTMRKFAYEASGMGDRYLEDFVLTSRRVSTRHFSWWAPDISFDF